MEVVKIMAKKTKNISNNNGVDYDTTIDYPIPFPTPIDREVLGVMDDDSLYNLNKSLNDSISKVNGFKLNPFLWEVELCYVQQEIQVRNARKAAHLAWTSKNSHVVAESV
jgi:hypothetical protein